MRRRLSISKLSSAYVRARSGVTERLPMFRQPQRTSTFEPVRRSKSPQRSNASCARRA